MKIVESARERIYFRALFSMMFSTAERFTESKTSKRTVVLIAGELGLERLLNLLHCVGNGLDCLLGRFFIKNSTIVEEGA